MTTDRFEEFFLVFTDGMTEDDHVRLWGRSRRESARALYDALAENADDADELRRTLYRHTCRLCGPWAFGVNYRRAATRMYHADLGARRPDDHCFEPEAERVLLEHHDCEAFSDFRHGDLDAFTARAVLDPEPILAVIRSTASAAADAARDHHRVVVGAVVGPLPTDTLDDSQGVLRQLCEWCSMDDARRRADVLERHREMFVDLVEEDVVNGMTRADAVEREVADLIEMKNDLHKDCCPPENKR